MGMIDLGQYKFIVLFEYKYIMTSHNKSTMPCDCKCILWEYT